MRIRSWVIAILAMLAILAGLGGYKTIEITRAIAAAASYPEQRETVQGARAEPGTFTTSARTVGTVIALRHVELRNELAGRVTEVTFDSGDVVEAGQVLVRFDTAQEEADLAALKAEADLAKLTLERQQRLVKTQAASEATLDQARSQLAALRARMQGMEVQIAKKTLHAPFKARVGLRDLHPGAYLSEGTLITGLQGVSDDAYVDFAFPQDIAPLLAGSGTVALSGAQLPGGTAVARIVARDAAVDDGARSLRLRAMVPGLGGVLTPGAFVDVVAETGAPRPALFVPLTAVRRAPHGDHVFVLAQEGDQIRARQRFVRLGPVRGPEVAVLSGLEAGEMLAADGSFKLREGLLVTVNGLYTRPGGEPGTDPASAPAH